ncbi:hypothetical protein LUZ60_006159 [Juncus effusus]|nr:hypothetical protein LUZ60_006159 [Juncus effusus]
MQNHHFRQPRPPPPQQPQQQQNLHQQFSALLSAASTLDSSPGSSSADGSAKDAARVAALDSLRSAIVYPPNSLLLPPSAPYLAQALSALFSDKSNGVRRGAVVAYGSLCGVLSSSVAHQNQPYPPGGGLPEGFIAWVLPLLRDTNNAPVVELALEGLRAMLTAGDPAALDRFIHPIVRSFQDLLEDERTTLPLLRHLLGLLALISMKYVHSFRPHFADIVDVLLGWAFVPDLSDPDRSMIMDTFFQFQGHWLSSLPFTLGLLSKFLGDMEVIAGPTSTSATRLLALLSCFSTVLGVLSSAAVSDTRLLDQMSLPLQSLAPRLLRCLNSMFGSDAAGAGRSKWMAESWKCVLLLAQVLKEKFSGLYEAAVDIVSHCLTGIVPSFQLETILKSNLRILTLQGTALLPSSVKAVLQFRRPFSQLRLHPNHLVVASSASTYLFFLQHASDGVASQAIASLLEELCLLKEMLGRLYKHHKDVSELSLENSGDNNNECEGGLAEHELLSLVNFDLKVLLAAVSLGNVDKTPEQIAIEPVRYERVTRLTTFLLEKFAPFEMPLSGSGELQFNILRTVNELSEVELLSNCTVSKATNEVEEVQRKYMSRYCTFIVKALETSSPVNLKLEALGWIRWASELFISLESSKSKIPGYYEKYEDARFPNGVLFSLLDSAYDRETVVRIHAAVSLEALFSSGLVEPRNYSLIAQVALDKLGDPDKSIKDAFLRVLAIVLPSSVYTCGFLEGCGSSSKNLSVSMNWQHVLAVKHSSRKFQPQQLVTMLSYISNRWKLPLSSWVQRMVFSSRSRRGVLSTQEEDQKEGEEMFGDGIIVSSVIDRICPVSNLSSVWWCMHEAARHCIETRLRTNLGGPAQTFAAFERMLLDVPNLITAEANNQGDANYTASSGEVSLLPMRLLLDFVESLKKNIYNAYEGSFLLPAPAKPSSVFFRANKKVCEEWFSRICDPMLNASLALLCDDAAFHYCAIKLTDLRSTATAPLKERSSHEGISILRDNSRTGAQVLKVLRHAALALCRSHEADILIGLHKWAQTCFSPLFGGNNEAFSWMSGLVYQSEGRYEMAAAHYSHLLQSEETLGSMDSDGIQFIVSRVIECYTSLSDWKCLDTWLVELQNLRSVHAGKPYSGALTTAGNEMNAINALARFDEGDLDAAWTSLDLTPKSSFELTLDPKIALERSEQMLIRSMLLHSNGSKEYDLEKARLMLREALSVAPLDGLTSQAATYAAHIHSIFAFEQAAKNEPNNESPPSFMSPLNNQVLSFPMDHTRQDCGMWMKLFRVYSFLQPSSLPTLHLCRKLQGLARKQGNFMLAHRMHEYLINQPVTSSSPQEKELMDLSADYEGILLKYSQGKNEEALMELLSFVRPNVLSVLTSSSSDTAGSYLKAKACLKLSSWLGQDSSNNVLGSVLSKITEDYNASSGNLNYQAVLQEVTGVAAKTACRISPTVGKTWLSYASWCFTLAKSSLSSSPGSVLCNWSLSPVLESELSADNYQLTDEEMSKVEAVVRRIYEGNTEKGTIEPVNSLVMQVVSIIQGAAGMAGSESRDSGESPASLISSQLQTLFLSANSFIEKDEILRSVDELVQIWWSLRQRRLSLFGHAAAGYFQYLSYSSAKLDAIQDLNLSKGKTKSCVLRAVLNVLHIILNYGVELRETLELGLSAVPILPWQEVIPQLFGRVSSHPEKVVRNQVEGLLMMVGKLSPCSIVYPTLVDINASEGNPSLELQHLLDLLVKHYPKLVQDVKLAIDELGVITVLWEEQWLSTLQDLHSDVMRRINMLKEESTRVSANITLSTGEKSKINASKYSAMMAPVIVALERRLATTSREPRTPHESWFHKEYLSQLASAISLLKTPPSSATQLAEIWRPFDAIAASLVMHHRKSSVSVSEVSPQLASLSGSEIPMPGFEKQSAMDSPGSITVSSFCEQLSVLSTKTKPKKLVMCGSDGQKYTYLLKGREDLRLDSRIMQLLEAINGFLLSSLETRKRSLAIRYYSVTPISSRAGLIQWVENVNSIYSVYKSWQKRTHFAQAQLSAASSSNVNNQVPVPPPVPRPADMYYGKIIPALKEKGIRRVISRRDWPLDVKRKVLLDLMKETPRQLLSREMWCASEGFRSFNLKTKRFSGSVAAMSMVGHILGLGDRHLDNMLMDLCTGDVVHIDYNICFDKGKRLKIPEIVPFRLTQIMETALGLTGVEGVFRGSCEAVMRVLRGNKDVILMLLEVFVWEPLTEWTRGNVEDEAAIAGEEKKGMDQAVSLSLFSSRLQEIRVPLQEHHDLLVSTLPAAESALKNLLEEFGQYERRSAVYSHAEKERTTLVQQESSAKSLLAEASSLSEKSRGSFELQAHELSRAKSLATDKAQDLVVWVDLHAKVLDSLRDGSIPTVSVPFEEDSALSLTSAVLVSGVPLTVIPEPTKAQCADLDKDVSGLMAELNAAISNATNSLTKYSLMLRRVLPSNYITTSPISGWAQVLQLSVSNLSSDMLSLAQREASDLISKAQAQNEGGGLNSLVQQRYGELLQKMESYMADIEKLDSDCSELMNSIESNNEAQSRERLFTATMKYVQSAGTTSNEEKRSKVLRILAMAVTELYTHVKGKVVDLSSQPFLISGSQSVPQIGRGMGFHEFEEQIERCVLVSGFVEEVEEAIGIKLSGSGGQWASTFQGILNASSHLIEEMSEAVLPEMVRSFVSHKSEVMEVFGSVSQIRGSVDTAVEKLVEVELERASLKELDDESYLMKVGLIKEQQSVLEQAAAKGRDHLSWEEADELASQEEACRAQLDHLHLTWNQKDMRALSLTKMETNFLNSLASSNQYLSSLVAMTSGREQVGRSGASLLLLSALVKPFAELESVDLLLPSEFVGSMVALPDVVSSGSLLSDMLWPLASLLRGHAFFVWKIGLVGSILDLFVNEISASVDHNFGLDQLYASLKRKLVALLHEHLQRYLKERAAPCLMLQLDKDISCLKSSAHEEKDGNSDNSGAVRRVVHMLEEYCNAHETARSARSAVSLMKRQINYLTDALGKTVLEAGQLEWLHDLSAPYTIKKKVLSQNIFGNDEALSVIINVSRRRLLDEIQSSVSSMVRSVERLQACERVSVSAEGQLERAMGWACAGPTANIPSQFHDHLSRRRHLLMSAAEQTSALVEMCTSLIEFEASRDGLFLPSYSDKGRAWQQLFFACLTRLDSAYHSFTLVEKELKLAQHNMETATSTLFSASSQLSMVTLKAKSSLAELEGTLGTMQACAREASEALSAFTRVSKGQTALTSESGSLLEEVLAITEGLHDVYSLGQQAAASHGSLMIDLSKANNILLPLEASLASDLAVMADALSQENEKSNPQMSVFIHVKALYQSYIFRIKEACQSLAPLVPSLTNHATQLHSMLIRLGRAASLHAGNLHKALEGIGESEGVMSEELPLPSSATLQQDVASSSSEPLAVTLSAPVRDNKVEEEEPTEKVETASLNSSAVQQDDDDEYWISPPLASYTSGSTLSNGVEDETALASSSPLQAAGAGEDVLEKPDNGKSAEADVEAQSGHDGNEDKPVSDASSSRVMSRGKNLFALSVLKQVEHKLHGRDFTTTRSLEIGEQVEQLVKQATSIDNLCNMYEGWTPWI